VIAQCGLPSWSEDNVLGELIYVASFSSCGEHGLIHVPSGGVLGIPIGSGRQLSGRGGAQFSRYLGPM
jgi:hypothetical protein